MRVQDFSQVLVAEPKQKVDLTRYTEHHQFSFDYAFDETAENVFVYNCTAKPLVKFVMSGGMGTCFAFGQTGSGKTFTMLGAPEVGQPGLYLLAADDVFRMCDEQDDGIQVYVSMMEIYGDEVYDLLSPEKKKLIPREDAKKKVQIQGLTELAIHSVQDMMEAIDGGSQQRSTSTTGMNEQSSRSHAILQMSLRTPRGRLHGQLSFIDLAGSEKGSDTAENEKKTRLEGAEINKSLLALKECIRSMTDSSTYTPFRGSKLTQVLKESFVGNGRTVMIANISPAGPSCNETVNTLRYADRVKAIGKAGGSDGGGGSRGPTSKPTTPSANPVASTPAVPALALQFSGGRLVLPGSSRGEEDVKSARKGREAMMEREEREKENSVGNRSALGRERDRDRERERERERRGQSSDSINGGRRRQSQLTLGRYESEGEESFELDEPTHKRRRSWGQRQREHMQLQMREQQLQQQARPDASGLLRAAQRQSESQQLLQAAAQQQHQAGRRLSERLSCSTEPSFEELLQHDHDHDHPDDEGFVYHGEPGRHSSGGRHSRGDPAPAAAEAKAAVTPDPLSFVNAFREQIEKSMALIEQEVVMLDRLERGGNDPLTPDNVLEVNRLLEQRMSIASHLQSELRIHTRA